MRDQINKIQDRMKQLACQADVAVLFEASSKGREQIRPVLVKKNGIKNKSRRLYSIKC